MTNLTRLTITKAIINMSIVPSRPKANSNGCVDFLTYCPGLNGWLGAGWIGLNWDNQDTSPVCVIEFDSATITGKALTCIYPREDVRKFGAGIVFFIPGNNERHSLQDVLLYRGEAIFRLEPSVPMEHLESNQAIARIKEMISQAARSKQRARLLSLLNRPVFSGQDTLSALQPPIFLETDFVVLCPPDNLLLGGWLIDPFHDVASIRVRCGNREGVLDLTHSIPVSRLDVAREFEKKFGGLPEFCGFLAFIPGIYTRGEALYFEVRSHGDEIGFKPMPQLRTPGLASIKDLLGRVDMQHVDMAAAYDRVIGPAVFAMNQFRMEQKVTSSISNFGNVQDDVVCSIIVPLYGRIDFMEYQLAFFSRSLNPHHEIIYVLDDPPQKRATEALARSCYARFRQPFRLVTLSANVGYAPANNIGLSFARGKYVCFLNSDVFPKVPDWLDSMVEVASNRPDVGAVGALLVFEDESVQHEGCSYEALPELSNWTFPLHPRKGRFPTEEEDVREVDAVTGACLLMPSALAREVGGFDEGFVIGDFEDVDLCRKVLKTGLKCVIDRHARLYHLERQSQGDQQMAWRTNLTLYNAWRFQKRWNIAEKAACS